MIAETYSIPVRSVTAEEVLSILREQHRIRSHVDFEVDADAILSFETTVASWRQASALVGWRKLGEHLNGEFQTRYSRDEWRAILTPERTRTLRDVCEAIARTGGVEVIEPVNVFGQPCVSAGAYLAVRRIFQDAGIDAARLMPQSPLVPLLRRPPRALFRLARLKPGGLPMIEIHPPWLYQAAMMTFVISVILGCVSSPFLGMVAPILFIPPAIAAMAIVPFATLTRCRVRTGGLNDLRDLSYVLSGQEPRRRDVRR